ncbi:MAG: alpha/beta fold hydrolase [Gammaproteobacteria bacterium]|nr:alpha/beta fold hydrolase [Gammaproteobacteria bacterium]
MSSNNSECVVLLHGLAMPTATFRPLEQFLKRGGYQTFNLPYPSRQYPIATLATQYVAPKLREVSQKATKIHVVTHSLGGIVIRFLMQETDIPPLERVIMLAPPHQGSQMADWLSQSSFMRWFLGPVLAELTTAPDAFVNQLGPVKGDVGILIGNRSLIPFSGYIFHAPNDGLVRVDHAKVEGMKDFRVYPTTHATIVFNGDIWKQIAYFLKQGCFEGS